MSEFGLTCRHLLAAMLVLAGLTAVRSEDAVERNGTKHVGRLQHSKDGWFFQSEQGKPIPLTELAYIRFESKGTPLPKAPLTHTLVLPGQQRCAGTLVTVDEKKVVFITSWGKTITLKRDQVAGIEQEALPLVHDDFETSLKAWRVEGGAALSVERAFAGKSSLLLDKAGQGVLRHWPARRDITIRVFFHDPATPTKLRWTFEIIPEPPREQVPALVIDQAGYVCANVKKPFAPMKAMPGWHLLSIEAVDGRLRIFVDDLCLGETTLPAKEAIKGIRIAVAGKEGGRLWLDELFVTRPLPTLPRPAAMKDQDMVWLEQGEELFGPIVSADADNVVLDAKFGKRMLPWSRLRGILFATQNQTPAPANPRIDFRPAPGFPVDNLRAKLLRWEGTKLIVAHDLLGEIAIERERLDKIRPEAK